MLVVYLVIIVYSNARSISSNVRSKSNNASS